MSGYADYADFLASKAPTSPEVGFRLAPEDLNPALFPWQADVVSWALARGRAALFEDTGLGKTGQQLEWARRVHEHTGRDVLILAPLGVGRQTTLEAKKFGLDGLVTRARTPKEMRSGVNVTNYERLHLFEDRIPDLGGVVLDESSILKGFGSKTRWALTKSFARTRFRLAATATPAPNDYVELGTHAKFFGLMDVGEMLTRWFANNTTKMRTTRLKAHGEEDFWRWVASWAACLSKPSDLLDARGVPYSDEGFVLPPLDIQEHVVEVDHATAQRETGELFRLASPLSATRMHTEMRRTAAGRAAAAAALVEREPDEPWVVWCSTNYEADEIMARLGPMGAVEVRGSDHQDAKEEALAAFSAGDIRVLVTKPEIAGFGLNWQHCARTSFVGLSYSFERFYQALRRFYRFGQEREVRAHVITAETETNVLDTVKRKQGDHKTMQRKMAAASREVGVGARGGVDLRSEIGAAAGRTESGEGWELREGDCVERLREVPNESAHFSIFSPPFSSLYAYSPSLRDLGNCADDEEFLAHFAHLVPELLRVTVSGRLCVIHVKDLPRARSRYGYGGLRDLTGEVARVMESHVEPDGTRWGYHSKVTIWTDPVREMQRTKRTALLYKTLKRDASYSAVGCPEYLVMFRKWTPEADAPEPVTHEPGSTEEIPLEMWRRYASPVWMDIRRPDVLNAKVARENEDEKHLAPLQLEVIRRCLEIWTNPGDLVFDPFSGLGSAGYEALQMNRRFSGIELKGSYFDQSVKFLRAVEEGAAQLDLLAGLEASV